MGDGARDEAARRWFGYGRWAAPYWLVGMEPGGTDDHASYESWLGLGGHALIDCREHHEDSNRRAGRTLTRWHHPAPPLQTTWGPLIQVILGFEGRSAEPAAVATYQRDHWGRTAGNTAVLEISALHAANMDVAVERTRHRAERIAELRRQLEANRPTFALFYGVTYRGEYEAIASPFNADGWTWHGKTLCVLTQHPAYRFAPPAEYWRSLGAWMKQRIAAGPGRETARIPRPGANRRIAAPAPRPVAVPAPPPARLQPVAPGGLPFDAYDPTCTLAILDQLAARHRFDQAHFEQIHHFGVRASLARHVEYCRGLRNPFKAATNATVAQRLHRLLAYLDGGQRMAQALDRVVAELPMPPR